MKIICVIPARGGSKRIPGKNLLLLNGTPLVAYSVGHALAAKQVSETYVSSDDPKILQVAEAMGAIPVLRPESLSHDKATSESALSHVLLWRRERGQSDPDLVVFLQPTSPARHKDDIDRAIETLISGGADSLFSGVINKALIWASNKGVPNPLNYNYELRRREQDMDIQYRENGSIYVFKPSVLSEKNNRLGGKIAIFEMETVTSFQIDEPIDLEICEAILRKPEFQLLASPGRKSDSVTTGAK